MAYPVLNQNKVYSALYNMISRIVTHGNYIANKSVTKLADKARIEGAEFGDTVIYRASDLLKSREFDPDDSNVLAKEQLATIKEQPIEMNVFRQIGLTLPTTFLAKQACDAEGSWSAMASVIEGLLRDTKDFHDGRLYNVFIGTDKGLEKDGTTEQKAVVGATGAEIATNVVKLINELGDGSREFNEYGFMRSYNESDLKIVWNADFLATINYQELPAVFHSEKIEKILSGENALPGKYFGVMNADKATSGKEDRAAEEIEIDGVVYYPGDLLPEGVDIKGKKTYIAKATIVGKVYSELPPFMSGIDTASEFSNMKNFSRNLYLTWGHNTLEHLKDCPSITLVTKA